MSIPAHPFSWNSRLLKVQKHDHKQNFDYNPILNILCRWKYVFLFKCISLKSCWQGHKRPMLLLCLCVRKWGDMFPVRHHLLSLRSPVCAYPRHRDDVTAMISCRNVGSVSCVSIRDAKRLKSWTLIELTLVIERFFHKQIFNIMPRIYSKHLFTIYSQWNVLCVMRTWKSCLKVWRLLSVSILHVCGGMVTLHVVFCNVKWLNSCTRVINKKAKFLPLRDVKGYCNTLWH